MASRKRPNSLHRFLIPHKSNKFRPGVVGIASLSAILFVVLLCEGAYLAETRLAFTKTNFLASVLPSVLISLTNHDRENLGAGKLTENSLLDAAAQLKANDMAAKGYFAHVTPDGQQPWYWISQAGYKYEYAGENLAVNFQDSQDVEQAWMNSPTHHANIVKPQYTEIGIATANGMYEGKDVVFVVQYFANPAQAKTPASPSINEAPATSSPAAAPLVAKKALKEASSTDVLGAQTKSSSPIAIAAAPIITRSVTAPSSDLTPFQKFLLFASEVVASPAHTILYILSALAVVTGILFLIALAAHLRAGYLESLGGTALIFAIVIAILLFNIASIQSVGLPTDTLSASVVNAL